MSRADHKQQTRKRELYAAIRKAGLPNGPHLVYKALLLRAEVDGTIPPDRQPTWTWLMAECNNMPRRTLADSLNHLTRHHWITRTTGPGRGAPTWYELHTGKPCTCHGQPSTSAKRMRRLRERQKATRNVTPSRTKDVTPSRTKQPRSFGACSRDKQQVNDGFPVNTDLNPNRGPDRSMETTHNGGPRTVKGEPPASAIAARFSPPDDVHAVTVEEEKSPTHCGSPRGLRGDLGGGPGGGYEPPGNERPDPTPAVPRPSPVADRMEAEELQLLADMLGAVIIGTEPVLAGATTTTKERHP